MWGLSSDRGLAVIRMGVGPYFLSFAIQKLAGGFMASGAGLGRQLQQGLAGAPEAYQPFLAGVVIPNADLFSRLVALSELFVGVTLLLGLVTRAGGIVGVILNVNYMLMKGMASPGGSVDRLFVLVELVLIVTAAGMVWGLDGAWQRWLARIPLVAWLAGSDRAIPTNRCGERTRYATG